MKGMRNRTIHIAIVSLLVFFVGPTSASSRLIALNSSQSTQTTPATGIHSQPRYPKSWSMYQKNPQRTGFDSSNTIVTDQLQLAWHYSDTDWTPASSGGTFGPESSPVISQNGILLFGTLKHSQYGGSLLAFDITSGNTPIWIKSFGPPGSSNEGVYGIPAIDDQRAQVYVTSWDGYIYALNLLTGVEIWKTQIASSGARLTRDSAVIYNGVVYIGSITGGADPHAYLYAIDAQAGTILDQFAIDVGLYGSVSIDSENDTLFMMSYDNYLTSASPALYSIDISNPSQLTQNWKVDFTIPALYGGSCWGNTRSTPVYHDGKVYYLFRHGEELHVFDANTGVTLTTYDLTTIPATYPAHCSLSTPSIAYGNIYIAGRSLIISLDLVKLNDQNSSTDPFNWATDIGPLVTFTPFEGSDWFGFTGSSPSIVNDHIFIGSGDDIKGRFWSFDAHTGAVEWMFANGEFSPGIPSGVGLSIATPAIWKDYVVFSSAHDIEHMLWGPDVYGSGIFVFKAQ